MDKISDEHGNSTFKLTTRQVRLAHIPQRLYLTPQTFQFHGIIKKHLKPAMQAINRSCLDSIAACGDVSKYSSPCRQSPY
jgi:sulfite reductase (NADPH) hemoprotein beta-component